MFGVYKIEGFGSQGFEVSAFRGLIGADRTLDKLEMETSLIEFCLLYACLRIHELIYKLKQPTPQQTPKYSNTIHLATKQICLGPT